MLEGLPDHLHSRARAINDIHQPIGDGPVVVWLKSALRIHENPAIDTGILIANRYQKPLLIYQAIDERYPHASLRHHNMLLDGALDLHRGCLERGLRYVLHVARANNRQSVVKSFSNSASCIITDLFPLPPWTQWVKNTAQSATCPVIEVDCHCVIPMTLFGKSVDRPFKFRDATKKMRKRLVQQSWPENDITVPKYDGELPFNPIDVEKQVANIENRYKLLVDCSIDPTVFPIWRERGGEVVSLAKWQRFLDKNLSSYSRRRNDAADPKGVSRLSAAFHYGFLSPMKVAREVSAVGTKSAEKYLDELLIFREHAWHHVFSTDTPYCSSNLPHWAIESWNNTSDDPRPVILSEHQIEYARSPNRLWNLCQKSLLRHGELHNNLRMTWGKAIPKWSNSVEQSLTRAQNFNDKYALDGRDPSSIAGVQWCHGLFDRPFHPPLPIMGIVRKRDLETHASRLDMYKYNSYVNRSNNPENEAYLVYGSNLIESYAARILYDNGINVYCVSGVGGIENDEQLNLQQLEALPKYFSDRLSSIANKINSNQISLICKDLVRGIPIVKFEDFETKYGNGENKLCISLEGRKLEVSGLISTSIIENSDAGILGSEELANLRFNLVDEQQETLDVLSHIVPAVWRLAKLLWPSKTD